MIFFDLEFYVPKSERNRPKTRGTLVFNPGRPNHLILGGSFHINSFSTQKTENIHQFWLWNYPSEKELLTEIYQLFVSEFTKIQKEKAKVMQTRVTDIVTCGIAISRIDLPALFLKGQQHQIAPTADLFDIFLKTKIIDLANVGAFLFPNETTLYPKTANQLTSKLIKNRNPKPNGKQVWDLYDKHEFDKIEDRCNSEVVEIIEIYQQIQKRIQNLS